MRILFIASFLFFLNFESNALAELNQRCSDRMDGIIERIERVQKVRTLYNLSLEGEDIIGLHGTSLEALKILIKTGLLPVGNGGRKGMTGGIYIAEISSQITKEKLKTPHRYDFESAYDMAEGMANLNTVAFSLGRALKIPFDPVFSKNFDTLVDDYEQRDYDETVSQAALMVTQTLGITYPQLERAIKKARKDRHEGVILALGKKVLEDRQFEVIDSFPDQGFFIKPLNQSKGIPMKFFTGLKALGEPEIEFLDSLPKNMWNF